MANSKRVMKNPYTFAGNGGLLIDTILNVISSHYQHRSNGCFELESKHNEQINFNRSDKYIKKL